MLDGTRGNDTHLITLIHKAEGRFGDLAVVHKVVGLGHTVAERVVGIRVEVSTLLNEMEHLHGGLAGRGLPGTGGEASHEGAGE